MKKGMKRVFIGLLVVVCLVAAVLGFYTVMEYRPDAIETITAMSGNQKLSLQETLTILTMNTGYAGLDETQDFFMDGGDKVRPESEEDIQNNLQGISNILKKYQSDIYFLPRS